MKKEVRNMYKLGFADYLLLVFSKVCVISTKIENKGSTV